MSRISVVALLGLATLAPMQALAQGAVGFPVGDVGQVLRQAEQPLTAWAPPPGPLQRLSKVSRQWIRDEIGRQIEAPRDPSQVMLAADMALEKDIAHLSRRERIGRQEILTAIVLRVMIAAEGEAADRAAAARKAADPAVADAARVRLELATAHRKEMVGQASFESLYMAAM